MQSLTATFTLNQPANPQKCSLAFQLLNPNTVPVFVCIYYTPLEAIKNRNVVNITNTNTNQVLPYEGVMCSRIQPRPVDYIRIDANSSITRQLTISSVYSLEYSQPYRVELGRSSVFNVRSDPNNSTTGMGLQVMCPPLDFQL
jgi:hypothetical protein